MVRSSIMSTVLNLDLNRQPSVKADRKTGGQAYRRTGVYVQFIIRWQSFYRDQLYVQRFINEREKGNNF